MSQNNPLTHWSLLVNGFDDKLLVVEGDVPDLTPGEADLRTQPGKVGMGERNVFDILTHRCSSTHFSTTLVLYHHLVVCISECTGLYIPVCISI